MQRFYFALSLAVAFAAQTTSANFFHLLLQARDFDYRYFVKAVESITDLEEQEEMLAQLDDDELTVFGRAIVESRLDAVDFLLFKGFEDIGPKRDEMTLAKFSMQPRVDHHIYVLLSNYEALDAEYSRDTRVKTARAELENFRKKIRTRTCPYVWSPQVIRILNKVVGEICESNSQSGDFQEY